jgi:signal peptidase I
MSLFLNKGETTMKNTWKKVSLDDKKTKSVIVWIFQIMLVWILAALVSIFFCQSIVIQEGSMEPTLMTGDRALINKVAYRTGDPVRGDIIVFKNSPEDYASLHVKRIIGLPGETVQIRDGQIYIDGQIYRESNGFPEIANPGLAEDEITLKRGEYFVLGDNRNNSDDSRFGEVANVKKQNIVGKLWFITNWGDRFGLIKN